MRGLTRVERTLADASIGAAIADGMHPANRAEISAARSLWASLRSQVGYRRAPAALLTSGASQYKLSKNTLASFGLMLTPERGMMSPTLGDVRAVFRLTGPINICPLASKGCALACLSRSGQSGMPAQQRAQAVRTAFLLGHPRAFGLILGAEIAAAVKRNGRINLRLNVTSDIRWELVAPALVSTLTAAGVTLYDYTAWCPDDRRLTGPDYHMTYSAKEFAHTSDDYLTGILASGQNVSVPFTTARGHALPATWHGYPVIDGDESDERYRDPRGVVVGLRAKGHAWRRDNTAGFIRPGVSS